MTQSPGRHGLEATADASACPLQVRLSLLAQGLLEGVEQHTLEAHVAECDRCRVEVTRLVEARQNMEKTRHHRRFPWVPTIATCTVLIACAIAFLLSGRHRYLPVTESVHLIAYEGQIELKRGHRGTSLNPVIGLALNPGDLVKTPDTQTRAWFISPHGDLFRFDMRGETLLARFGAIVSLPGADARISELEEVGQIVEDVTHKGMKAFSPRGNILDQTPTFEIGGISAGTVVEVELREEVPRIRQRWNGKGPVLPFPTSGRPLERGRTFFWKAKGMRDEQAFVIASEDDVREWNTFRVAVADTAIPRAARLVLESRYLLNRGFHQDALDRVALLTSISREDAWPREETALILDRLGRSESARLELEQARKLRH